MPAGLSRGTAISIVFLAKSAGEWAAPACTTECMFVGEADANTSAGAPCEIWAARAELAPKLNVIRTPGCAASNCLSSARNDSVSDAAADTVIEPRGAGECDEPPAAMLDVSHPATVTAMAIAPSPARSLMNAESPR